VRYFYCGAGVLLLVLAFLGFNQFYLHGRAYPGRDLTPPIRTLLVLHGTAMAAWLVLFTVQAGLIAGRRARAHMTLGWLGAALAAATVALGWNLGIAAARVNPPDLRVWGLLPRQFLIVPVSSIATFGAFVALGVWTRRRSLAHRPMMLLAALAAMPAAVSRIDFLDSLYVGTMWETAFGPYFMTLLLGGALLAVRCAATRSFERWFAAGWAVLVASSALVMQLATSRAWDAVAGRLLG
jgi:hypothetical protein